jgi:pimeloyl-ACP methyl ester carboxylesterase
VKLRLYHHHDGARIAYREAGTGPPLALLHSAGLSHREWEPLVEELGDRFRLVLPDLPLHGDSEDRPRHSYSPEWLAEVLGGFVRDTCGPRPLVGGHETGALLLFPPKRGPALSARGNPAARDLIRHATMDLGGNVNRARAWSKAVRRWPRDQPELLDGYRHIDVPVLLLWADEDPLHPLSIAEEALDLLPDAMLRVLPGTGFLMAYDDPVGLARELAAFCV